MPAEVLVMCSGCGHPQSAPRQRCARCGAALPALDFVPGAEGREAEPDAPRGEDAVFWHADLGGGRALALTRSRLGFREAGRARSFEVSKLAGVSLVARPTLAGLFVTAAAIGAFVAIPHPVLRGALMVAGAVGLLAFFFRRSYQLRVRTLEGGDVQLPIGVGTLRAPDSARIGRVWESLRGELQRLGVTSGGQDAR